jgi:uncharacterized protein (DUF983 family)
MNSQDQAFPPISPLRAGLPGRCPRCGKGRLFNGFLALAPRCEQCGLDFGFADAGDGPAVFVMSIAGFIVLGGAMTVEILYKPPFWVHALLWLPAGLAVPLMLLRPFKGVLVALQYRYRPDESYDAGDVS